MTGRLLWLPAALRRADLKVDAVPGWETRGRPSMHPKVILLHHTAGSRRGNAPSLNICVNGRAGLPGPLCQILIGRDGTCFVIASGVSNHAGAGSWQGVTGNSNAIGIEVENVGTTAEPWTPQLVDVMIRAARVCAQETGIAPAMVCGHKEWAPTRKIDPHTLSMADIRKRIATPTQEDDMTEAQQKLLADTLNEIKVARMEHAQLVDRLTRIEDRQIPEETMRQGLRNIKAIGAKVGAKVEG